MTLPRLEGGTGVAGPPLPTLTLPSPFDCNGRRWLGCNHPQPSHSLPRLLEILAHRPLPACPSVPGQVIPREHQESLCINAFTCFLYLLNGNLLGIVLTPFLNSHVPPQDKSTRDTTKTPVINTVQTSFCIMMCLACLSTSAASQCMVTHAAKHAFSTGKGKSMPSRQAGPSLFHDMLAHLSK